MVSANDNPDTGEARAGTVNWDSIALDPLTGIANRRLFDLQGDKALALAQRHYDDLGLVMLRVEDLVELAQRSGLVKAKQVMQLIARCLQENVRNHDTAARLSRSRFGVLLPGAREFGAHKSAVRLLSRIRETISEDAATPCTLSAAATATNGCPCRHFDELSEHARGRLREAVEAGGNRIVSGFCQ